jgi:hypothetical protein
MKNYYTAEEAAKKLDIPKSTFHLLVRKGEISKVVLPLRKQGVYSKKEIDEIAERKEKMLQEIDKSPNILEFKIPNREDLEQLIEIERDCYHEDTIIPISTILERMKYNPENIHVLKDIRKNRVVGSITMSPIKEETLYRLINLEIDETQVEVQEYLPYIKDKPLDCYVVSIIAEQSIAEKYYASRLLIETVNYLIELLERGINIKNIYTVATTEKGEKLAKDLGLKQIKNEWKGEKEDFRHSYVINLENISSKSKLINLFKRSKINQERRKKRHNI